MKLKIIILLMVAVLISSPVYALTLLTPTGIEWYNCEGAGSELGGPAGAFDKNNDTYAGRSTYNSSCWLKYTYPSDAGIQFCNFLSRQPSSVSGKFSTVPDWNYGGFAYSGAAANNTWYNLSAGNSWTGKINPSNGTVYMQQASPRALMVAEIQCYGIPTVQTEVNFTGYPLDGYAPLTVSFTVTNASGISESAKNKTWTFGDGTTSTAPGDIINHTYSNPGIYAVSMKYTNLSGVQYTISKPDYVLVSNASGMIVNLDVKDAISGALIQDSTVGIRNTTTGVWRNTTAPTGLVYFSTTDPGYLYPLTQGQSITLAANKTGYRDASETFAIPYNNYRARLFLMPTTVINSTGTGTVVVNTIRNKDGLTISGISVVLDSGQMGMTNTAGATTLYNVTAGTRYVTLTDPDKGYQDAKSTFNLSAGETKLVVLQMVRVGEQPVETPGSPTPTPTGTYDPNDPNSPVYGNYTTSQINEQGGAGVLGMLAQLIALWPLVVVGVLFKFMKSAFS